MRSVVAHIVSCILLAGISLMTSCREDEVIILAEYERLPLGDNSRSDYAGLYLLNEGNMGSNKCSLDFVDFDNGYYVRNLYAEKNPNVVKELGDVGNDVQIYGSKMYAVINCSHKVEVLDARSCQRLGQVDIPNCRYIAFDKGFAYVSAYVGPVGIDPNAQLGAVFQVDTATLEITAEVTVGYQPDELVIQDGLIYVANSEKDKRTNRMEVRDTLNVSCSEMDICGDSLYLYSVEWSNISQENNVTYGIIDVRTGELISNSFIKDGTETDIEIPYGLKVNPETGDVYVTDAKNYVSSGNLHCYGRDGIRKWSVRTGDIPAHMAFLYKNK